MRQIALSYISQPEQVLQLMSVGIVVAGFLVSLATWHGEMRLRRVLYILGLGGTSAAATLGQMGWLVVEDWNGPGLSIAFLVSVTSYLAAGYLSGILSIARSRDIKEDRSVAWLGIVPFANLYLFFAAGQNASAMPSRRPAWQRFLADPLLILLSLILFAVPNAVATMIERDVATRTGFADSGGSLAEEIAHGLSADLPMRIDEITQLVEISARDQGLMYVYEVETDRAGFVEGFERNLLELFCGDGGLSDFFTFGLEVDVVYRRASDGARLLDLAITPQTCAGL